MGRYSFSLLFASPLLLPRRAAALYSRKLYLFIKGNVRLSSAGILVEILLKLPPKSVIRFRCVSKSWNLIISNPCFISMHCQQSFTSKSSTNATSDQLMVRYYLMGERSDIYSVHSDDETFNVGETLKMKYPICYRRRPFYNIVGSHNGVLCLSDDKFARYDIIVLWNPSIRRKVILPLAPSVSKMTEPCVYIRGFGYDEKNKDYKVVRISYVPEVPYYLVNPKVEIYMVSVGNWREIDVQVPSNVGIDEYCRPPVFLNGNVHWLIYKRTSDLSDENLIMVFSMTRDVFDEMQLPYALSNKLPTTLKIAAFGEALAVCQYEDTQQIRSKRCLIWVMEEYGVPESWQRKFDIDLTEGLGIVLGFRKNGLFLVGDEDGSLISYDPKIRERKDLGIIGRQYSFFVDAYVESLALLIEGEEVRGRIPSDNSGNNNGFAIFELDV